MKKIKNYLGMFVLMFTVMILGAACGCTKDTETYKISVAIINAETGNTTANAGTVTGFFASKEYSSGEEVKLVATVNDGWLFNGYFLGTMIQSPSLYYTVKMDRDVALTARYVRKEYTIKFYETDGNQAAPDRKIKIGDATDLPVLSNKGNLVFAGWAYKETPSALYTDEKFGDKDLRDISLEARFEEGYSLSYKDGNTVLSSSSTPALPSTARKGYVVGKATPLPSLSKEGYNFVGWSLNQDLSGDIYTSIAAADTGLIGSDKPFSNDVVLYAKFTAIEYNIEFVTNGGNEILPIKYSSGSIKTLPIPTGKKGYEFVGWSEFVSLGGNMIENSGDFAQPSGDKVVYAKWRGQIVGITYDVNGGDKFAIGTPNLWYTYDYDDGYQGLPTPTRKGSAPNGYVFLGWSTVKPTDMSTPVIHSISADSETHLDLANANGGVLQLYAKWGYKVIVQLDGATINGSSSNYEHIFFGGPDGTTYEFLKRNQDGAVTGGVFSGLIQPSAENAGKILILVQINASGNVVAGGPQGGGDISTVDWVKVNENTWSGETFRLRTMWV